MTSKSNKKSKLQESKRGKRLKVKTEGQRQLLEQKGTQREIASKVGCGEAVVGHWCRGRRIPGEDHRHKLELLFGIPQRAWDILPGAKSQSSTPTAKPNNDDSDETLAITNERINCIRKSLKDEKLTDAAASKKEDTLAKLLALRARLERDQEMLEDRAVREHPEWKRTKAAILRALKKHPEAAADVAEAIK
jgi:transcriptional regulator with XRE-family HTH domain